MEKWEGEWVGGREWETGEEGEICVVMAIGIQTQVSTFLEKAWGKFAYIPNQCKLTDSQPHRSKHTQ